MPSNGIDVVGLIFDLWHNSPILAKGVTKCMPVGEEHCDAIKDP